MLVASYVNVQHTQGDTRTYQDYFTYVGAQPARLGVMSRMYSDLTGSYLTESLRNTFYMNSKSQEKFRSINSMMYEWNVVVNFIKRVKFAAVPVETGENNSEITMAFKERYYEKYDTFRIEKTHQQCFVVSRPFRKADNYWEVRVVLIGNDYKTKLDVSGCQIGDSTRFISNNHPEGHQEGYTKSQSNVEKHRNFISTHRVDTSWTALYAAQEDVFVRIAKGEGGGAQSEKVFCMTERKKELLESFLYVRNNGMLFSKTNVDKNGKPTIYDPVDNRPIYIGEGLIPQVERFASKTFYNKMSVGIFNNMMAQVVNKSDKPTGNIITVICNEKYWYDVQQTLGTWLAGFKTCGTYLYSKEAKAYLPVSGVGVGATFVSYEMGGNILAFKVDRTFSREWGNEKGFAMFIDLTADKSNGNPAIAAFTLKGGDFITNTIEGVGGQNGLTSGPVSSPVAASRAVIWGYDSIAAFTPYRSAIMREV